MLKPTKAEKARQRRRNAEARKADKAYAKEQIAQSKRSERFTSAIESIANSLCTLSWVAYNSGPHKHKKTRRKVRRKRR